MFTCLVPAASLTARHGDALHQLGAVLRGEFVPLPLVGIGDEVAGQPCTFLTARPSGLRRYFSQM